MYIYGKNTIKEYLKKNEKIDKIYFQQDFHDQNLKSTVQKLKIDYKFVPKSELDRLAKGNHQGIIGVISDFKYTDEKQLMEGDFLVILDHLEDPHNFGAIIRTSEAAGVDGIIIPKDRSVSVNETVSKVSTGCISRVNIARVTNLASTIEKLKKAGFWIVGTNMNGTNYDQINYQGKIAIIIGNEGKGMSDLITKKCDFIATIPMKGEVNSLNASVATGILLFEALKQRR